MTINAFERSFFQAMAECGFWEARPRIAVGLSGGADSVSLIKLLWKWKERNKAHIVALHVDHRMRPSSGKEAKDVKKWCEEHGQESVLLESPHPVTSQKQARDVRYALMGEWCKNHHFIHLLLAHHTHDQAETLLMRRNRGSGVRGLAGMALVTPTLWGRLVRPMLYMDRVLWEHSSPIVYDESNYDCRYERVRVRDYIRKDAFLFTNLLDERDKALEQVSKISQALTRLFVGHVRMDGYGSVEVSEGLLEAESHMFGEVFGRVCRVVSGRKYPIKRKVLDEAMIAVKTLSQGKKATVGGCVIKRNIQGWSVFREYKRIGDVSLPASAHGWFDNRFLVFNGTGSPLTIRAKGLVSSKVDEKSASLPCLLNENGVPVSTGEIDLTSSWWRFVPRHPLLGLRLNIEPTS